MVMWEIKTPENIDSWWKMRRNRLCSVEVRLSALFPHTHTIYITYVHLEYNTNHIYIQIEYNTLSATTHRCKASMWSDSEQVYHH